MATLTTAMDTVIATARRDHFADGTLEITTSADAVLATFALTAVGGTVSSGIWTIALDNATVAAGATGTAAKARIKTSGGTSDIFDIAVTATAGGGEVEIDNTAIVSGQDVVISSATVAE